MKKSLMVSMAVVSVLTASFGALSLGALAAENAVEQKGTVDVYLIGGQSNAVGYGEDAGGRVAATDARFTNGFSNVLYYGNQERSDSSVGEGFQLVKLGLGSWEGASGAEIGIASSVADDGGMNAVIKCAWGATHLYPDSTYDISKKQGTWTSPTYIEENNVSFAANPMIGNMYTRFVQTVKEGVELLIAEGYTPVIKGMWWMQGEAEMFTAATSSVYDELLTALISDVRDDVSKIMRADYSEMPFVLGLPDWNDGVTAGKPAYENDVRANMKKVAENGSIVNVDYVDCAGLTQQDSWHFDAESQKYLGEQFIAKVNALDEGAVASFAEKISLLPGAAIRTSDQAGLRFSARISDYNPENGYEYGMIILPTKTLVEEEAQIRAANGNYLAAFDASGVEYAKIPSGVGVGDADGNGVEEAYILGAIDVEYKDLNTQYTGIGYVYDGENDRYLYTTAEESRSVSYVASAALFDYEENDPLYEGVMKYAIGAINEKNGVAEENGYANADFDFTVPQTLSFDFCGTVDAQSIGVVQAPQMGYAVKFSSANENVVAVDENGLVTPVGVGKASVDVTCMGITKTVSVSVSYPVIDGIALDGVRDDGYGELTDTVTLDGGRWYNVSAVKTNDGVVIHTQALFLTSEIAAAWGNSTDFEFKLNAGGPQRYVALGNQANGVTQYVVDVQKQGDKYLHTFEVFVDKSIIYGWDETEDVQINYAWKSPTENAYVLSDMMDHRYIDWNTNWHSYQRLGGLSTYFAPMPSNLFISEDGLRTDGSTSEGFTVDGDLSEYDLTSSAANDNSSVEVGATVSNGDLYVALSITHGAWSSYTTTWHRNDNIELHVNDRDGKTETDQLVTMFYGGKIVLPAYVTDAAVQTSTVLGFTVTNVELYIKGDCDVYRLRVGLNGAQFGWLAPIWSSDAYVTEDGILSSKPVALEGGIVLDGVYDEAAWTETAKSHEHGTAAHDAGVTVFGRKTERGILVGGKVVHQAAPDTVIGNQNAWWAYMGIEMRINNGASLIATCLNQNSDGVYSYCKTTEEGERGYTSYFEIYVQYADIGVSKEDTLNVAFGGWFEKGWDWLFFGSDITPTHIITEEGILDRNFIEDDVVKILTIGNSFSDDTMEYVGQIAESMGFKVVLGNLYIAACDLQKHLDNVRNNTAAYEYRTYVNGGWKTVANYKMRDAILSENWDYISLQQASGKSGIASSYSALENLRSNVRDLANANAELVWNMTWAYQSDSTHGDFVHYGYSQKAMYDSIVSAVQNTVVPMYAFSKISPTGTAIQNARATSLGDTLTRDGYHLNLTYGRYIAGLTFFFTLMDMAIPVNLPYAPDGMSEEIKQICIQCAGNAIETPYQVTV